MKKALPLLLALCALFCFYRAYPMEDKVLSCSIDDAVARARASDLEYERLAFALKELVKSKKNLYLALFPRINTAFSSSNLVNVGEPDTRNYLFSVTLEQVLYDQLATPLQFKSYGISLEEANLKLKQRGNAVSQGVVNVYLDILFGEERLRNSKAEHALYERFVELVRDAHSLGMKTMLEIVEAERKMLEAELAVEELTAQREILYKDLANMIGAGGYDHAIELASDVNDIIASTLNLGEISTFDEVYAFVAEKEEKLFDRELLKSTALRNDFALKKNRLTLVQNRLKQKLLSLQYLDNVSLSYGVDFSGDRFFPANTTHTVAVNLLLDFGILSSDVSLAGTSGEGLRSESRSAESKVLESLDPMDAGKYLKIEAFTTGKQIERSEKEIVKRLDVWIIKMRSLMKSYTVKLKQKEIFEKNEELFQAKLEIGEAKKTDYMEFLIGKNEFLLELESVKYDFIRLIWELEGVLNVRFIELPL